MVDIAWSTLPTYTDGQVLTAALVLALRDCINETAPAKATAAGRIFVSTGVNAIAERVPSGAGVLTLQSTSTTASFGDLTTAGPAVSVATGAQAIVIVSASIENDTAACGGTMAFAISGATTLAADANRALRFTSDVAATRNHGSRAIWQTGLTPGTNVFTAKYTTPTGGEASFSARDILVIPL